MVAADMGSLRSVRAAATRILVTEPRLDVLIDNAGAIFPERTVGPDGIEGPGSSWFPVGEVPAGGVPIGAG